VRKNEQTYSYVDKKADKQCLDRTDKKHVPACPIDRADRQGSFRHDLTPTNDEDVFVLMNEVHACDCRKFHSRHTNRSMQRLMNWPHYAIASTRNFITFILLSLADINKATRCKRLRSDLTTAIIFAQNLRLSK